MRQAGVSVSGPMRGPKVFVPPPRPGVEPAYPKQKKGLGARRRRRRGEAGRVCRYCNRRLILSLSRRVRGWWGVSPLSQNCPQSSLLKPRLSSSAPGGLVTAELGLETWSNVRVPPGGESVVCVTGLRFQLQPGCIWTVVEPAPAGCVVGSSRGGGNSLLPDITVIVAVVFPGLQLGQVLQVPTSFQTPVQSLV